MGLNSDHNKIKNEQAGNGGVQYKLFQGSLKVKRKLKKNEAMIQDVEVEEG